MSTKEQTDKNLQLSEELLEYLSKNPQKGKQENFSYVVFTTDNKVLNKANLRLVTSLVKEGKKVIKATKTNDKKSPWEFSSV